MSAGQRIVLVGAGHAHLHVLKEHERFARAGAALTLVDDGDFWYSSMASGLLGGRYDAEEDRVDVAALARACGVEMVRDRAVGLDRDAATVTLEGGTSLPFDAVSFNVGSGVEPSFAVQNGPNVWYVKPIVNLLKLRDTLAEEWSTGRALHVVVIGGGPSGCEMGLAIDALARKRNGRVRITLVTADERLLMEEPTGAGRMLDRLLAEREVEVLKEQEVASVTSDRVRLASGEALPFDHVVIGTGLAAKPLVRTLGLPADHERGLTVTRALHSPEDERVFAAGDCADVEGRQLPRLGVFGVRAAPVLTHNLLARVTDGETRLYRPQPIWLAALNLGDGTGLGTYGPLWWRGRSALALKEGIDRRFMAGYRALYADEAA